MCLRTDGRGHAAAIACAALLACAALACVITGCGKKSADLVPVRLLHTPPIQRLDAQQLRSLSMQCERYSPHDGMRGRYDAAYCEEAMAAWADAPLQMVTIKN